MVAHSTTKSGVHGADPSLCSFSREKDCPAPSLCTPPVADLWVARALRIRFDQYKWEGLVCLIHLLELFQNSPEPIEGF